MNIKTITVTVLALLLFAFWIVPQDVVAQSTNAGISILQITPAEASGPVGTNVNVQGTIYTSNGYYQVLLNRQVVANGKAEGYYVNANFTVPGLPAKMYPLILRDVAINMNSTGQFFTVSTGYTITSSSVNIQEGASVTIVTSITGAHSGTSYYAKIVVALPNSQTTYSKTIMLSAPDDKGTARGQVTFPGSDFEPLGSTSTYSGVYSCSFNGTLAQNKFTVNIIDQISYHRGQTLNLRATGYESNQHAIVTVTNAKTGSMIDTFSVTSTSEGIITSSYIISSAAEISDYNIKIIPTGTQKVIPDSQIFSISGYAIKIQTANLAGEPVSNILVRATDATTRTTYAVNSDINGVSDFKFEKGPVELIAFWDGVNVGSSNITITGDGLFSLKCQLTNLKITVKNEAGIIIPFVNLNIQYNYQNIVSRTGNAQGQTGPLGSYTLRSALAGATYKVDASIYDQTFNAANNTFSNLPNQATVDVFIICPNQPLNISVTGYDQALIQGARVELVELSNGLFFSANTDNNGVVNAKMTFGIYRVRVYKENSLIAEIPALQIFNPTERQITASLYGIPLKVKVVDAFGTPINNAQVLLNGPQKNLATTKSDGIATFENIIGGNMQIISQAQYSDIYQAITVTVDQPKTIVIKMENCVAFGSILFPATFLVTIVIVLLSLVMLIVVEVVQQKRNIKKITGQKPVLLE